MQSINDSYKELNNRYKGVVALNDLISKEEKLEEDDRSYEFLGSFLDNARIAMRTVEEKIKGIEEKYIQLIAFFGDTPKDMPMDTFIEIFNKFNKDLTVISFIYLRLLK